MSQPDLDELERDVEQARARFADDLARLRSPRNLSAFKADLWAEATQTKDELIEKTKEATKDGAQRLFSWALALILGGAIGNVIGRPPILLPRWPLVPAWRGASRIGRPSRPCSWGLGWSACCGHRLRRLQRRIWVFTTKTLQRDASTRTILFPERPALLNPQRTGCRNGRARPVTRRATP